MSLTATKIGDGQIRPPHPGDPGDPRDPRDPGDRRPPGPRLAAPSRVPGGPAAAAAPVVDGRSRPSVPGAPSTTPAAWSHVADLVNRREREIAQIRAGLARIEAEGMLGDPDGQVRVTIRRILAEARGEKGCR